MLRDGAKKRQLESEEMQLQEDGLELLKAQEELKKSLSRLLSPLSDLFTSWDTDGNGSLSRHEFARAVSELGLTASSAVCNAVFDDLDFDADSGSITYGECVRSLLRNALAEVATSLMDSVGKMAPTIDDKMKVLSQGSAKRLKREEYVARVREKSQRKLMLASEASGRLSRASESNEPLEGDGMEGSSCNHRSECRSQHNGKRPRARGLLHRVRPAAVAPLPIGLQVG